MRKLGIDFGSKRVGVAISDETNVFAIPKVVIVNDKNLITEVAKLCKENDVDEIIIGDSRKHDMSDNKIMKSARVFADDISKETGIPVHFELEFMSSVQAAYFQGETKTLDASAAAIILQSYLDSVRVRV
jgi:putative Holliday junction resolvase